MSITGYQPRPRHLCSMAAMTLAALAAVSQQSSAAAGTGPATTDALIRPQAPGQTDTGDLDAVRLIVSQRIAEHEEHLEHEGHLRHESHLAWEKREAQEQAYVLKHVRRHIIPVVTAASVQQPSAPAADPVAASGSPRQYALSLVGSAQFSCLDPLWERESGWNAYADNPSSGAYGIPQSLPGDKMASAGADWQTDPDTQVRWGISYIDSTYGSPCGAWQHEEDDGWY
jgi:hypothetical protein